MKIITAGTDGVAALPLESLDLASEKDRRVRDALRCAWEKYGLTTTTCYDDACGELSVRQDESRIDQGGEA